MSHAALMSGIALANSGLGMAHGVAAALGVHCHVPHGLACAVMLPIAMHTNLRCCVEEFAWIDTWLGNFDGTDREKAENSVSSVYRLLDRIGIPARLGDLGVTAEQIPDIVRSSRGNSMDGNPRDIDDEELDAILRANL